jgi:hypothetical protein
MIINSYESLFWIKEIRERGKVRQLSAYIHFIACLLGKPVDTIPRPRVTHS